MAIALQCTLDVGENLAHVVTDIRTASDEIRATATEIHQFNQSMSVLTKQVILLNRILIGAMILIGVGMMSAGVAGIVAIL